MQTISTPDIAELKQQVKQMYRQVALQPHEAYHFEMGRALAEKLGYDPADLDRIPPEAIESFAGVGYFMDYAAIAEGERVLDLGSGSGMDSFLAALKAGKSGWVQGLDMTDEQLEKAERLRNQYGFSNIGFRKGYIESIPFEDSSFDVVISNGVINLCTDKAAVFREIGRILRPGGRLALADIVSESSLPENIVCNATLWASCIGGAAQQDDYRDAIEAAGFSIMVVNRNEYGFISSAAKSASRKYGVKSISLLAERSYPADASFYAPGMACAHLTPAIKKELQLLEPGGVLEVISDDPSSREGVPAWCRLTGNSLLAQHSKGKERTAFYIKRKKTQ